MISRPRDAAALAASAESLVERVFGAVQALRERELASRAAADARRETMRAKDIAAARSAMATQGGRP